MAGISSITTMTQLVRLLMDQRRDAARYNETLRAKLAGQPTGEDLAGAQFFAQRLAERMEAALAMVDATRLRARIAEDSIDGLQDGDVMVGELAARARELEALVVDARSNPGRSTAPIAAKLDEIDGTLARKTIQSSSAR